MAIISQHIATLLDSFDEWYITLLRDWPAIVGSLSNHMCVERFKDDTLILGVYDTHWIQELHLLAPTIRKTINTYLNKKQIEKIRFKLVERHVAKKQSTPVSAKKIEHPRRPLSDREKKTLHVIKDQHLRVALQSFLERSMREAS